MAILAGGLGLVAATWPYRGDLGQDPALTLVVGALIVLWIGGFVLLYGRTAARAALFPLLFLAFTMPFPNVVLEPANNFLKNGSTELVAGLFTLSGGIRSSIGQLITTLLAGYLFLFTAWKRAALVLAIVPMTILKNAIRIVALSSSCVENFYTIWRDPESLVVNMAAKSGPRPTKPHGMASEKFTARKSLATVS